MSLDKSIINALQLSDNIYRIDITVNNYKKLKESTIQYLKDRNIKVVTSNRTDRYKIYIYKKDCFAFNDEKCEALTEINCTFCKFYRNDITLKQIEDDIIAYSRK